MYIFNWKLSFHTQLFIYQSYIHHFSLSTNLSSLHKGLWNESIVESEEAHKINEETEEKTKQEWLKVKDNV